MEEKRDTSLNLGCIFGKVKCDTVFKVMVEREMSEEMYDTIQNRAIHLCNSNLP